MMSVQSAQSRPPRAMPGPEPSPPPPPYVRQNELGNQMKDAMAQMIRSKSDSPDEPRHAVWKLGCALFGTMGLSFTVRGNVGVTVPSVCVGRQAVRFSPSVDIPSDDMTYLMENVELFDAGHNPSDIVTLLKDTVTTLQMILDAWEAHKPDDGMTAQLASRHASVVLERVAQEAALKMVQEDSKTRGGGAPRADSEAAAALAHVARQQVLEFMQSDTFVSLLATHVADQHDAARKSAASSNLKLKRLRL